MSLSKLYPKLNIDNFPEVSKGKNSSTQLNKLLSDNVCTYTISVIWSSGLECDLLYMGGKVDSSTKWNSIITKPVSDDDGEMSFELGHFTIGRTVSISLGLHADTSAIPRIAVLVKNTDNGKVFKFPAGDDFKRLDIAETLPLTFDVILP